METTIRDTVLNAATRLYADKGFPGVSSREIAAAAGVGSDEISRLFGNEETLYRAVLEAQFGFYAATMSTVFDGDEVPAIKVELFARAMCDVHKQAPCFFPLLYRELLTPSPFFEEIVRKNIRHVAYLADNNFVKGIRKGTFKRGVNPAHATMYLAGMFHYYFLASRLAPGLLPETGSDEEYFSQAIAVYLSGVRKGA
jgi:AcrR family transcriptional regulator